MLLDKGKITPEIIGIMDRWRHSGFNVYCGTGILPREKKSLERLAAYLIRSSFSLERMEYLPDQAQVRYRSKDGKEQKSYDALEYWPPPTRTSSVRSHLPSGISETARCLSGLGLDEPVCAVLAAVGSFRGRPTLRAPTASRFRSIFLVHPTRGPPYPQHLVCSSG
jgi:hypothetical protein